METKRAAVLSSDLKYRYSLNRIWDPTCEPVVFIGLNPSTADAVKDDPTIRRCVNFAKTWGYGELVMLNLFAYRSTNPLDLLKVKGSIIGPDNDEYWDKYKDCYTIGCWGNHAFIPGFGDQIEKAKEVFGTIHCLGETQAKQPRHPLYIANDFIPIIWYSKKLKP